MAGPSTGVCSSVGLARRGLICARFPVAEHGCTPLLDVKRVTNPSCWSPPCHSRTTRPKVPRPWPACLHTRREPALRAGATSPEGYNDAHVAHTRALRDGCVATLASPSPRDGEPQTILRLSTHDLPLCLPPHSGCGPDPAPRGRRTSGSPCPALATAWLARPAG